MNKTVAETQKSFGAIAEKIESVALPYLKEIEGSTKQRIHNKGQDSDGNTIGIKGKRSGSYSPGYDVVERWGETPTWQFFSGQAYFEHRRPCDATTLIKFRQLLGDEGVEELLAQTINVAVDLKLIKPQELTRVIVDSTVQHKAIAHPTDSRLLETARNKLVEAAKEVGIHLKQTFAKEGKELGRKAGRYAHARQFKRMRRAIKRQRTIRGPPAARG